MDEKKRIAELEQEIEDLIERSEYAERELAFVLNKNGAGYRKIPEGAVMLNKDEWEKALYNARKETARDIIQTIKSALDEYRLDNEYFIEGEPNGNLWQMNASIFYLEVIDDGGLIDQIAQRYGVEVE